jgi:exodeoxyribonuclease VII small subunit
MAEEQGFAQARARLEEIVVQVRKKDTSLEQSLDLLEEGVRLANQCTELVDHSEWRPSVESAEGEVGAESSGPVSAISDGVQDQASADVPMTSEPPDAHEPPGGTDAADTVADAAEPGSKTGSGDEYDDIFADED